MTEMTSAEQSALRIAQEAIAALLQWADPQASPLDYTNGEGQAVQRSKSILNFEADSSRPFNRCNTHS